MWSNGPDARAPVGCSVLGLFRVNSRLAASGFCPLNSWLPHVYPRPPGCPLLLPLHPATQGALSRRSSALFLSLLTSPSQDAG